MSCLFNWIWTVRWWLPKGVEWADLHPKEGFSPPIPFDIYFYPTLLSFLVIAVRVFLNTVAFEPIARYAGIKNSKLKLSRSSAELEKLYSERKGKVDEREIQRVALSLSLTTRQVERWLRKRGEQERPPKIQKFTDTCFILTYHVSFTILGLYILLDKPWIWDFSLVCKGFPYHDIDNDVWWYYMIGSAFYISMLIWENRYQRMTSRDATVATVHHLVTLFLLVGSWNTNFIRVGSLVFLIHEGGDIMLLLCRLSRYMRMHRAVDYFFFGFALMWHFTRMGLYPFWIIRGLFFGTCSQFFEIPPFSAFHLLLYLLLLLNIIWTGFIDYAVYKRISLGYMKDVLTDAESDDEVQKKEN